MRGRSASCLGARLMAALPSALAGAPPASPPVLAERYRAVATGRSVLVMLPSGGIDVETDVGRVMSDAAYGGGLLGALILSARDKKREQLTEIYAERAKADSAPLRQATDDLPFDQLAMQATRSAITGIDWFGGTEPVLSKAPTDADKLAMVRTAGTQQLASFSYRPSLSPDFTQLRVVGDIEVWLAPAKSTDRRPGALTSLSRQRITAIVELDKRAYDHAANAAVWAAEDGKLARAALAVAFGRFAKLIPVALNLTDADIAALGNPKANKQFAAGFYGPPVTKLQPDPGEVLIWSNGLVDVTSSARVTP